MATARIVLQYLPSPRARTWRTAYTMRAEGRATMEAEAPRLAAQDGWHAWRIADA